MSGMELIDTADNNPPTSQEAANDSNDNDVAEINGLEFENVDAAAASRKNAHLCSSSSSNNIETPNSKSVVVQNTIAALTEYSDAALSSVVEAENMTILAPFQSDDLSLEDITHKRKRRTASSCVNLVCPVCGLTLRAKELEQHYLWELSRLSTVASAKSTNRRLRKRSSHKSKSTLKKVKQSDEKNEDSDTDIHLEAQARHTETLTSVKTRRIARIAQDVVQSLKATAHTADSGPSSDLLTLFCPVCNSLHADTHEQISNHLVECLSNREDLERNDNSAESNHGDDDDECYEEYTWCGQKRIRTTTLLQGNLQNIEGRTVVMQNVDEDGEDLDVDGDSESAYGTSQYKESDIIPCKSEIPAEEEANKRIRQAMTGNTANEQPYREGSRWRDDDVITPDNEPADEHIGGVEGPGSSQWESREIEHLKSKIGNLEDRLVNETTKCLICMEPYETPLISVACWHVYCEECWMRALGAKKLCPKCNLITTANDLRRIYL